MRVFQNKRTPLTAELKSSFIFILKSGQQLPLTKLAVDRGGGCGSAEVGFVGVSHILNIPCNKKLRKPEGLTTFLIFED